MITWKRNPPDQYIVEGPEAELQPIADKLKAKGFRPIPGTDQWVLRSRSFSVFDFEDLEAKLTPRAPKAPKKPAREAPPVDLATLAEPLLRLPLKVFQLSLHGGLLTIKGPVKEIGDELKKAGGKPDAGGSAVFTAETLKPKLFKGLDEVLRKADTLILDRRLESAALLDSATGLKLYQMSFGVLSPGRVSLTGNTQELAALCRAARGEWVPGQSAWVFSAKDTDPTALKTLINVAKEASNRAAVKIEMESAAIRALLGGVKDGWPNLGVRISQEHGRLYLVGNTFPIKDSLRGMGAVYDGSSRVWSIPAQAGTVKKVIEALDALESKTAPPVITPAKPARPMVNRKPGPCTRCHVMVMPGEGLLHWTLDEDDDEGTYEVTHADAGTCRHNLERAQESRSALATAQEAAKEILQYFRTTGGRPQDPTIPSGKRIPLYRGDQHSTLVRAGSGNNLWLITENGSDGDDWSRNNIPGAIALVAPMTPQVETWVQVLVEANL